MVKFISRGISCIGKTVHRHSLQPTGRRLRLIHSFHALPTEDFVPKTLGAIALVCALSASVLAARPAPAVQSDLDDFMKQVLANRDENWKKLQQYILEEREAVEVRGPSHVPVWGDRREYSWFIRDGYFIRSPVKANGVTIGEADRQKAEDSYLKRVKAQDKKQREKDEAKGEQADTTANAEKP